MKEIWKKLKDNGFYEISNYGRFRSLDRYVKNGNGVRIAKGKIIKPTLTRNGYLEYSYKVDGKRKVILAHRLVAMHFIENPNNLPQINHKDENIKNNVVTNIEWCSAKYNANYGTRNERCLKSNEKYFKKVKQFDKNHNFIKEYKSLGIASKEINGDISAIIRVCKGKQKTAYNYIWEYSN